MDGPEPKHEWITTAADSREIDRLSASEYGISQRHLMAAAGEAVFRAMRVTWPGAERIGVLCGPGNNGGDGYVFSRCAAEAGLRVVAVQVLSPSATCHDLRLGAGQAGVAVWGLDEFSAEGFDLLVDAVFGTGLSRNVDAEVAALFEKVNGSGVPVLAVDIPSGIDCDTGRVLGSCVRSDLTVSFGNPKPYLFLGEGAEACGSVVIDPIVFPEGLLDRPTSARVTTGRRVDGLVPARRVGAHKGSGGKVLVLAGSEAMPGAAVLATRAALRSGAGLVYCMGGPGVRGQVVSATPEAVTLDVSAGLPDWLEPDAAVIGPGLEVGAETERLVAQTCSQLRCPVVLDASALTMVATGRVAVPRGSVLTPHPGEAGRLLGVSAGEIQARRWDSAREVSEKFGCVCVLKGAGTVVASRGHALEVNWTGNQGMASAGMGDVLAGIVGGLIGQGMSAHNAAVCSVYWHGRAGDLASKELGAIGFLASDLIERLPQTRPGAI